MYVGPIYVYVCKPVHIVNVCACVRVRLRVLCTHYRQYQTA